MKLASYTGIRPGLQGLGNISIRIRLDTVFSHSEIVFEPGDGVDHLMPDGTCEPNEQGELWCASSVFSERLPDDSPYRPGKLGGVRFKRIKVDTPNWELLPIHSGYALRSAQWFFDNRGRKYDYRAIAMYMFWMVNLFRKYVLWFIPYDPNKRVMCSESGAASLGVPESERVDPPLLRHIVKFLDGKYAG